MNQKRSAISSQQLALQLSPNVEVHIEELVLHGFASDDRYAIGVAVERELARLLAQETVASSPMVNDSTYISGRSFAVARGAKAEAVGVQIAGAVYGGLRR